MELVFQEEVCFLLTGTRVIHGINNTKERETHGRTRQSMMIDSLTSASLLSSVIIISRLKAARDKGGVSLKKNVHVIIIFFFFFSLFFFLQLIIIHAPFSFVLYTFLC